MSLSMLESLRENLLTDVDSNDLRVIILSGGSSLALRCVCVTYHRV